MVRLEQLLGRRLPLRLQRDYREVSTKEELSGADFVGLYFGGGWCPPCRRFAPELSEVYENVNRQGIRFEVVYVSGDRRSCDFEDYYGTMPWMAIPYSSTQRDELFEHFQIEGIPTLVLFDAEGNMTKGGCDIVRSDRSGQWFQQGSRQRPETTDRLHLHWPARKGQIEEVRRLLALRADVNAIKGGKHPLDWATMGQHEHGHGTQLKIVELLLQHKADVTFESSFAGETGTALQRAQHRQGTWSAISPAMAAALQHAEYEARQGRQYTSRCESLVGNWSYSTRKSPIEYYNIRKESGELIFQQVSIDATCSCEPLLAWQGEEEGRLISGKGDARDPDEHWYIANMKSGSTNTQAALDSSSIYACRSDQDQDG